MIRKNSFLNFAVLALYLFAAISGFIHHSAHLDHAVSEKHQTQYTADSQHNEESSSSNHDANCAVCRLLPELQSYFVEPQFYALVVLETERIPTVQVLLSASHVLDNPSGRAPPLFFS